MAEDQLTGQEVKSEKSLPEEVVKRREEIGKKIDSLFAKHAEKKLENHEVDRLAEICDSAAIIRFALVERPNREKEIFIFFIGKEGVEDGKGTLRQIDGPYEWVVANNVKVDPADGNFNFIVKRHLEQARGYGEWKVLDDNLALSGDPLPEGEVEHGSKKETERLKDEEPAGAREKETTMSAEAEDSRDTHVKKSTGEVIKKEVEQGLDQVGSLLFETYQEQLRNFSPALGKVSKIFREASDSLAEIDKPGEQNKLLASMKALYEQARMGGYRLKVTIPDGASDEEKITLARKQMKKDFDSFPQRMAKERMTGYYQAKAELDKAREELNKTVSQGLSRTSIRKASFLVKLKESKLSRLEEAMCEGLGRLDLVDQLYGIQNERQVYVVRQPEQLDGMEDSKLTDLIEETVSLLKEEIAKEGGPKHAKAFENLTAGLDEDGRREMFKGVMEKRLELAALRANLESSVATGDPALISENVNKIKLAKLALKLRKSELDIRVASQRHEDAREQFQDARAKLAHKLSRGRVKSLGRAIGSVFQAGKEVVGSKVGVYKERVGVVLGQVGRELVDLGEVGQEEVIKRFNRVDRTIAYQVKEKDGVLVDGIARHWRSLKEKENEVVVKGKRLKVEIQRKYYEIRHRVEIGWEKTKSDLGVLALDAGREVSSFAAELVGGREVYKKIQEDRDRRKKAIGRLLTMKRAQVEEVMADNPYFGYFDEALKRDVEWVLEEGAEDQDPDLTGSDKS